MFQRKWLLVFINVCQFSRYKFIIWFRVWFKFKLFWKSWIIDIIVSVNAKRQHLHVWRGYYRWKSRPWCLINQMRFRIVSSSWTWKGILTLDNIIEAINENGKTERQAKQSSQPSGIAVITHIRLVPTRFATTPSLSPIPSLIFIKFLRN